MLLDEAVSSTAPLGLFYGCTQIQIHHSLRVIMEISVHLFGVQEQLNAFSSKDAGASKGVKEDFQMNTSHANVQFFHVL